MTDETQTHDESPIAIANDTQPSSGDAPEASTKCEGATFLYVRAEVGPPDPERAAFSRELIEGVLANAGDPLRWKAEKYKCFFRSSDFDPAAISFQYAQLVAENEEGAYKLGPGLLPELRPDCVVANDYVVRL